MTSNYDDHFQQVYLMKYRNNKKKREENNSEK